MANARRAVVIGIDDYPGPKIETLCGAVLDATEVHQVLTENGRFEITKEHFLTNTKATSENIRSAISDLFWRSYDKEDIAIFYFAGHGIHDHLDNGYLLPYDVDIDAPFVKGISIQEFKNLFLASKINATAIMILDCCYSGIATQGRSGPDRGDAIKKFDNVLGSRSSGSGQFILASARADERAREEEMTHTDGCKHVHGKYSFHLIEALRGVAGGDSGQVSLSEVINHIDRVFPAPFSARGMGMDGIWLTNIPEKLAALLNERYDQIESFINNKMPRGTLVAIERIKHLQGRGIGDKQKLENYLLRICKQLAEYSLKTREWWIYNNPDLYDPDIDSNSYDVLGSVMTDLTIENYCNQDKWMRGVIIEAVEAAVRGKDYQSVARFIRDVKLAPLIASVDVLEASGATTRSER
jgi:hypothetical protein